MTTNGLIIEVRNGQKRFGAIQALSDIDLAINEGEIVTLLGPSGCGKTTLMRIIAGFDSLSEGTLHIAGQDVASLPPEKRPVNMVFQRYALFPHLDVFENVAYGLKVKGISKDETRERVQTMLRIVQMEHLAHRYINELSGGQCQRVALARALVNRPKVLLLDEPLAALDLKIRQHMLGEMKRIQHETGATFLYVTHDQDEAMILSDRVVLLERGQIVQIDPPKLMYNKPRSLFAAKFLGETNIISGELERNSSGCHVLKTADGHFRCDLDGGQPPVATRSALMSVRPEAIVIGPSEGPRENTMLVQVSDVLFTGSRSLLSAVSEGGQDMRVQVQNSPNFDPPKVGDRVRLSWKPESAVVLAGAD